MFKDISYTIITDTFIQLSRWEQYRINNLLKIQNSNTGFVLRTSELTLLYQPFHGVPPIQNFRRGLNLVSQKVFLQIITTGYMGIFCPVHPPRRSAVHACPFGRNPSISLLVCPLVFFPSLPRHQLLSLHSLWCYSLLSPSLYCLSMLYDNDNKTAKSTKPHRYTSV